jgi:hypothetical protein
MGGCGLKQMGRRLLSVSVEAQRWWTAGLLQTAAAAFVDTARVADRIEGGARGDVDAGVGLRIALPGAGTIRADVANGLRHGGTRWTFVYEP